MNPCMNILVWMYESLYEMLQMVNPCMNILNIKGYELNKY